MKEIYQRVRAFVIMQKPMHWVLILLFCAVSIYVNYGCGLKQAMNRLSGAELYLAYFTLYAVHFIAGFLLYSLFTGHYAYWRSPGFLLLTFSALLMFTVRVCYNGHFDLIAKLDPDNATANGMVFKYIFKMMYTIIPVAMVWWFADRQQQPLYGFSTKNHKSKTYWLLLLCMVPLIGYASTQGDFLNYYPRVNKLEGLDAPAWKWWLFEVCYGADFISIELFFRGFLIMAFTRYVGIHAVLPMACFYLSIHYGKPMGEAISSFFGGTILGVISFHTRSIYGGVMVHVGIAWLMEAGGYVGNVVMR